MFLVILHVCYNYITIINIYNNDGEPKVWQMQAKPNKLNSGGRFVLAIYITNIETQRECMTIWLHSAERALQNPHCRVQSHSTNDLRTGRQIARTFGCIHVGGSCRIRMAECKQFLPNTLRAGFQKAWKFGCIPHLQDPHCGGNRFPPKTLRAGFQNAWKFECIFECGCCRTCIAECNQIFMHIEVPIATSLVDPVALRNAYSAEPALRSATTCFCIWTGNTPTAQLE